MQRTSGYTYCDYWLPSQGLLDGKLFCIFKTLARIGLTREQGETFLFFDPNTHRFHRRRAEHMARDPKAVREHVDARDERTARRASEGLAGDITVTARLDVGAEAGQMHIAFVLNVWGAFTAGYPFNYISPTPHFHFVDSSRGTGSQPFVPP
ncbi:hypothetical protein C8R44DRAFT_746894 [Mycena epipterygia]|nr:hypothetical protein C8R44DRAFT_746894 [Mycena epipterygia]